MRPVPASVGIDRALAGVVIDLLRYKAACPDSVVFERQGEAYFAIDDDAAIVAEITLSALQFIEVAGERFRLAAVRVGAFEAAVQALRDAGHNVAIAEQMEDTNPKTGRARTAIVRVWKERPSSPHPAATAEDYRGALHREIEAEVLALSPDDQFIALRMLRRFRELIDNPEQEHTDGDAPILRLCMEATAGVTRPIENE